MNEKKNIHIFRRTQGLLTYAITNPLDKFANLISFAKAIKEDLTKSIGRNI